MLKPLKFNCARVWFTSDLHLNHDKDFIYQRFGVNNEGDYRRELLTRWNVRVQPDDPVFILGDTVLKDPDAHVYREFLPKLNGKMYLLFGNHNSGMKVFMEDESDQAKDVTVLGHYAELIVHGQPIVLCHYPILCWNDYVHGTWMLHGHNHGRFPDHLYGKIEDVGLDRYPNLVSYQELKDLMAQRAIIDFDTRNLLGAGRSF